MKNKKNLLLGTIWTIIVVFAILTAILPGKLITDMTEFFRIHDMLIRIHLVSIFLGLIATPCITSNIFQKSQTARMKVIEIRNKETFSPATAQSKNNFSTALATSQYLVEMEDRDGVRKNFYINANEAKKLMTGREIEFKYKENTIVSIL